MKKSKIKRFVVLDTGAIIDLETYGLQSWGSDCQDGLIVKDNKVYETYWRYGGGWEDDIDEETLLGTIVYSSDKPFHIKEANSAILSTKKPDYSEYGVDVEKYFGMENKNGNRNNGNL